MNVKEVAEACGVSEQAIRQLYKRRGFRKVNGKWRPTRKQIESVLAYYKVSSASKSQDERKQIASKRQTSSAHKNELELLQQELEIFSEQLSAKDKQIEELQNTINSLVETNKTLAANAAMSTAADKKEILLAEPIEEEKQPERKRGLLAWLFG